MTTKPDNANPSTPPSTNGRDGRGRFVPGNKCGKGNPYAAKVQRLREAGWEAVKPAEVRKVFRKLLALSLSGDVQAARLLLDRLLGPPIEMDILSRLEVLEGELSP